MQPTFFPEAQQSWFAAAAAAAEKKKENLESLDIESGEQKIDKKDERKTMKISISHDDNVS